MQPKEDNKPVAAASAASVATSSDDDDDAKSYSISQALFDDLQQQGFSENAIKKSIVAGCVDLGTCVQWITMHAGHPELDTPLEEGVEVIIKAKRVLTEAEREAKVKELKDRIQQVKEEEKKEEHRKRMEQIQMGRKALEVKEQMEAVKRKLDQEEVRREKAADAEARRKVKLQIIADRYVRQGKTPDDAWAAAEEEFEKESQKVREAAAARLQELQAQSQPQAGAAADRQWQLSTLLDASEGTANRVQALFDSPSPPTDSAAALVESIKQNPDEALRTQCLQTLNVILTNIRDHPFDMKKRTLKVSTKVFSQKILPIEEAVLLLRLCNFDLSTDAEGNQTIATTTVVLRQLNSVLQLLA